MTHLAHDLRLSLLLVASALALVAVLLFVLTRRIHAMSISLDALTAQVSALQAAVAVAVADLGTQTGGPTQADVDAITANVKTATDALTAATPAK